MRTVALAVLLSGCAASRAVAPMGRGNAAITASLGGPMFEFGAPVPAPLLSTGVRYGLSERTSVHGGVELTPILLVGVAGANAGVNTELWPASGARPRLMLDGTLWLFAGDNDPEGPEGGARLFPDLGALASWDLGRRRHHVYGGAQLFTQLFPEVVAYPYPVVGGVVNTGRVGWQLELGWPALTSSNLPNFVEWVGPFHQGAISVHVGASVALGRREAP